MQAFPTYIFYILQTLGGTLVVIHNHFYASIFITYFSRIDNKLNVKLASWSREEYVLLQTPKQHVASSGGTI